jgi:predicted NBD/HSP70 family sugar kinase
VAAIDLGPTRTRLAVADLRGERLAHRLMPTPAGLGPKPMLSKLAGAVKALLREAHLPPERLLAVAAGAPGAVDRDRGMVVALAPNLRGWSQVPMAQILRRALGAPVVVENDVNLAILGERWRGAARGHDTCAYVTVGTGIGAGIVVDGELHRGHHSLAGEIALMCMGPQYVDVDFGSRGCLETLAGLKAVAARWSKAGRRDRNGWVAELIQAAESGDPQARAIADETAALIGIATANLCLVLDPSLVVLGGALIAQAPSLIEDVHRIVAQHPMSSRDRAPSREEAPLWGALLVANQEARVRLRQRLREARVPA